MVGEENIRYDKMIGSHLSGFFGLYSDETKQTDIFKVNPYEFTKIKY